MPPRQGCGWSFNRFFSCPVGQREYYPTDPGFSRTFGQYYAYPNTTITLTGFKAAYEQHFYWRVRARNAAGAGAWSAPWDLWMEKP